MSRILIHGGRLIDPAQSIDATLDLAIAEGHVVAVGNAADFQADQHIDARGLVVCPGFIDLCARLREPGLEHKADIVSETRAAVSGGITTLICPPDTNPVVDEPAVVEMIRRHAAAAGLVRVLPLGALTRGLRGEQLAEMAALQQAGCIGVSNAWQPFANTLVLRRALEYAATFDLRVFINPLDAALAAEGCVHDGRVATRLGLPGIPAAAESAALAHILEVIRELGVRVHFNTLSCARSVTLLRQARVDGLQVSADVSAHQLHLDEQQLGRFDSLLHLRPPVRTVTDRDALRQALADGVIHALCSDHQPHEPDAKADSFAATEPGISTLETLLGLGLTLVNEGVLSLAELVARLSYGPAQVLGLPLGQLTPGSSADVCVFAPDQSAPVDLGHWHSRGRNSPFGGWTLPGQVQYTLLAGRVVFSRL